MSCKRSSALDLTHLRSMQLCRINAQDVPIITADLSDQASLEDMASKAKVLLSTVGPFSLHGTPVVEACVSTSTDYCDITGWLLKP